MEQRASSPRWFDSSRQRCPSSKTFHTNAVAHLVLSCMNNAAALQGVLSKKFYHIDPGLAASAAGWQGLLKAIQSLSWQDQLPPASYAPSGQQQHWLKYCSNFIMHANEVLLR